MLTFEKFAPFMVVDDWEVRFEHYPDKELPAVKNAVGQGGILSDLPAAKGMTFCKIEHASGTVGYVGVARCSLSEKFFSRSKGRKVALTHALEGIFDKDLRRKFWIAYLIKMGIL